MPNRLFLRANVQAIDALLWSPDVSLFAPVAASTVTDFIKEEVEYPFPLNPANTWGQVTSVQTAREGDLLGPLELNFYVNPIISAGQPGICFVDGAGFWGIYEWRETYASNPIQTLGPDWFFIRYQKMYNDEDQFTLDQMVPLNRSFVQRMADALVEQHWIVPIWRDMATSTANYEPIVALAQNITYRVKLRSLGVMLNVPGGAAPNLAGIDAVNNGQINNLFLRGHLRHLTGTERDSLVAQIQNADGIAYMIEQIQIQESNIIPAQTTRISFQIRNINTSVAELFLGLRPTESYSTDVATVGYLDPFRTLPDWTSTAPGYVSPFTGNQYFMPSHLSVVSNGQELVRRQPTREFLLTDMLKYHSARGGGGWLVIPFSQQPELDNANMGAINFGSLAVPTLVLEWNDPAHGITQSSTAGTIDLMMVADCHNFRHAQGGDYVTTFQ